MKEFGSRSDRRRSKFAFAALLTAGSLLFAACGEGNSSTSDAHAAGTSMQNAASGDPPEVLATVEDEEIRMEDLPAPYRQQLLQLENSYRQQRHSILTGAIDGAVLNRMLAAEAEERGMTIPELVDAETDPVREPTDGEVEAWYQANRARLDGRSLEQVEHQIREHLQATAVQEQNAALDRRLREKYHVEVHLEPFRIQFDNAGSPATGPQDAAVTLVEFSDFECPFCGQFSTTLKQIEDDYGDRVRIVYRQFPIPSIHEHAFKAAEASLCADDQGEFWAYHDLLFQEQDQLAVRNLKEKAGRLGLDQQEFDRCLDTGRYVEQVQNDQAAAQAAGVSGTPALFVNGIPIPGGAVGYDVVAEALDRELARAGS